MKISENMKEWFVICVFAAFTLLAFFGFIQCTEASVKQRQQEAKENPVEFAKERCYSKIRGSRPACWTEGDWIEFCKHVECKRQ